jgi:hypothetical protein
VRGANLRAFGVAAATLAAVVGIGFTVQAVSLGRPDRGSLLVLRTVARLVAYQLSHSTMTIDGRQVRAVCRQSWPRSGRLSTVVVADGPTLTDSRASLAAHPGLGLAEFDLAGCPRSLARWLATQLNRGTPLQLKLVRLGATEAYAFAFASEPPRLQLYVGRRSGLPLALSVSTGVVRGASRLTYGRDAEASSSTLPGDPAAA